MITVKDLTAGYGAVEVLGQVNMVVKPQSVMAIIGRNGVGKTTLLKTLMGLIKPKAGSILFAEKDITNLATYLRVRGGIAYVPQGRQIFPRLSVEDNLRTGLGPRSKSISSEVYEFFPVLRDMRQRMGGDLSGGQQQQLSIARALVTKPEVLILDEPTEGIQPNIIQKIGEVLQQLSIRQKMTIIVVEQYLDFIHQFSSDFSILNRGKIVATGPTTALNEALVHQYLHV